MTDQADGNQPLALTVDDLRRGAAASEIEAIWIAEVERVEAENERLREALRGLMSCHGMAVNPGTQHAKCGYLAAAHAALSGSHEQATPLGSET